MGLKMRNKFFWIIVGLLIAILGGVVLLIINSSQNSKETTPVVTASPQASNNGGAVKEITIQATEYSFFPNSISVKAGDKVQITFKNMGAMPHNLTIEGLNLTTKTIGGGQSDTLEFVPDKPGSYTFYCSVGSHRDLGMEGTLEVK